MKREKEAQSKQYITLRTSKCVYLLWDIFKGIIEKKIKV